MSEELDIEAIEARANAATPGPWLPGGNFVISHDGIALFRTYSWMVDEEFVAHARADVPALVAEVRKLREAWTAMNAAADKFCADWKAAEAEVHRLREEIARMRERGAS